ncbi:MAG: GNAT family N-acetyltransferase [Candidatus Latescibacteria bacterium]|nr:GNAT family N-acetyltransferase [Candidatus Latescibacterota bacterium]
MDGPRSLRPEEFESLCQLVNAVFRPDGSGRMERQYPLLFSEENFEHLLVMVDGKRVVSHVGTLTRDVSILGRTIQTISIGAVATYPEYRGQGLATALMQRAVQKGKEEGSAVMLISGGRGLYQRLGAVRVGQYAGFTVDREAIPTGAVEVVPAAPDDIPVMTRIYAREAVRYVRSVDDFRTNVASGWVCDRAGESLLIRQQGRPLAYAGVQRPRTSRPNEPAVARLVEIAGVRSAIVQALPALIERYGAAVEVITLATDAEMAHLMKGYGITPAPVGYPGTVKILLPEHFIATFLDYIEMLVGTASSDRLRWKASNDHIHFICGDQSATFDSSTLTQLCFGVVEPDVDPRTVLPEDTELRALLDAVFPLPLVWYGYNYV